LRLADGVGLGVEKLFLLFDGKHGDLDVTAALRHV
jgi:hypothetical protein